MKFFILFASVYITIKSIGYSVYECKQSNLHGAILVIVLALFQLIFTNSIVFILNR